VAGFSTFADRAALAAGILCGDRALRGPLWVCLEVTRRCNISCAGCFTHCRQGRSPRPAAPGVRDLDDGVVESLCRDLPRLGTRAVVLVGDGEPLLHQGLGQLIARLARTGLRVELFTNGTLLDEERAALLAASGLARIWVSVWAVDEAEHALCHPGVAAATLSRRREGIARLVQLCRKRGFGAPEVALQMPLNRRTAANLGSRISLTRAMAVQRVGLGFFRDAGGAYQGLMIGPGDHEALAPGLRDFARQLDAAGIAHNLEEFLDQAAAGPGYWRRSPCYAGWYAADILADGTVLACGHCRIILGNLRRELFADLWNGERSRAFRRLGLTPGLPGERGCDCANCCSYAQNRKVHRVLRPVATLLRLRAGRAARMPR
jgi:MoaA/NifB/PqqE/SkfB family radical SAM enzyme